MCADKATAAIGRDKFARQRVVTRSCTRQKLAAKAFPSHASGRATGVHSNLETEHVEHVESKDDSKRHHRATSGSAAESNQADLSRDTETTRSEGNSSSPTSSDSAESKQDGLSTDTETTARSEGDSKRHGPTAAAAQARARARAQVFTGDGVYSSYVSRYDGHDHDEDKVWLIGQLPAGVHYPRRTLAQRQEARRKNAVCFKRAQPGMWAHMIEYAGSAEERSKHIKLVTRVAHGGRQVWLDCGDHHKGYSWRPSKRKWQTACEHPVDARLCRQIVFLPTPTPLSPERVWSLLV